MSSIEQDCQVQCTESAEGKRRKETISEILNLSVSIGVRFFV